MFCTKCSTQLPDDVKFCPNCGVSVKEETAAKQDVVYGDVIDEDVIKLVGENNTDFYVKNFNQFKQLNKETSWNWPAFLVAPAWFFYRKMYLYGVVLMAFNVTIGSVLNLVLSLAVGAVIAVFANYIYMDYLEKLSLQMKSMPETVKETFIKEKGGTSGTAVLVSLFIGTAISAIINLIF